LLTRPGATFRKGGGRNGINPRNENLNKGREKTIPLLFFLPEKIGAKNRTVRVP